MQSPRAPISFRLGLFAAPFMLGSCTLIYLSGRDALGAG
jgi:hypothetical protein